MGILSSLANLLTHPDAKAIRADAAHWDGWKNFSTGIGTGRDKNVHGRFWPTEILDHTELLSLFNGSALARKVVEKIPQEMFRMGYGLTADGVQADAMAKLKKASEKFRTDDCFCEAETWGALFGGCLLLMGIDDGQTPDKPLNEDRIRSVQYLNMADKRFAWVQSYYSDPLKANYGMPELYLITPNVSVSMGGPGQMGGTAGTTLYHESRVIRFDGLSTDILTKQQLAGWSIPTLQPVYDKLKTFEHSFASAGHLLSDAAQAVFKFRGLIDAIAAGKMDEVQARVQLLDMSRSTARAVVLDAGDGKDGAPAEEFTRQSTPLTGVDKILEMYMLLFAAEVDWPQTELFGRAPQGMDATGDGDTRKWYGNIRSRQTRKMGPKLLRWLTLLAKASDSPVKKKDLEIKIEFAPLWAPTDLEAAQTKFATAQADQIYITTEVFSPEEVALDRQDDYPSADMDSREAAIKATKSFDPHANDPETPEEQAAKLALQQPPPGAPAVKP